MYPGDSAQTITATVKNTGTENYKIQAVKAFVTTDKEGCDGTDYMLNGNPAPTSQATAASLSLTPTDLAPAATTTVDYTLQFNNKTTNQDACKGAAVTITYVARRDPEGVGRRIDPGAPPLPRPSHDVTNHRPHRP